MRQVFTFAFNEDELSALGDAIRKLDIRARRAAPGLVRIVDGYEINSTHVPNRKDIERWEYHLKREREDIIAYDLILAHSAATYAKTEKIFHNAETAVMIFDELIANDTNIPGEYLHRALANLLLPFNKRVAIGDSLYKRILAIGTHANFSHYDLIFRAENKFFSDLHYNSITRHLLMYASVDADMISYALDKARVEKGLYSETFNNAMMAAAGNPNISQKYAEMLFREKRISSDMYIPFARIIGDLVANPKFPFHLLKKKLHPYIQEIIDEPENSYLLAKNISCPLILRTLFLEKAIQDPSIKNVIFEDKSLESHYDTVLRPLGYDESTLSILPLSMKANLVLG